MMFYYTSTIVYFYNIHTHKHIHTHKSVHTHRYACMHGMSHKTKTKSKQREACPQASKFGDCCSRVYFNANGEKITVSQDSIVYF